MFSPEIIGLYLKKIAQLGIFKTDQLPRRIFRLDPSDLPADGNENRLSQLLTHPTAISTQPDFPQIAIDIARTQAHNGLIAKIVVPTEGIDKTYFLHYPHHEFSLRSTLVFSTEDGETIHIWRKTTSPQDIALIVDTIASVIGCTPEVTQNLFERLVNQSKRPTVVLTAYASVFLMKLYDIIESTQLEAIRDFLKKRQDTLPVTARINNPNEMTIECTTEFKCTIKDLPSNPDTGSEVTLEIFAPEISVAILGADTPENQAIIESFWLGYLKYIGDTKLAANSTDRINREELYVILLQVEKKLMHAPIESTGARHAHSDQLLSP